MATDTDLREVMVERDTHQHDLDALIRWMVQQDPRTALTMWRHWRRVARSHQEAGRERLAETSERIASRIRCDVRRHQHSCRRIRERRAA